MFDFIRTSTKLLRKGVNILFVKDQMRTYVVVANKDALRLGEKIYSTDNRE